MVILFFCFFITNIILFFYFALVPRVPYTTLTQVTPMSCPFTVRLNSFVFIYLTLFLRLSRGASLAEDPPSVSSPRRYRASAFHAPAALLLLAFDLRLLCFFVVVKKDSFFAGGFMLLGVTTRVFSQ